MRRDAAASPVAGTSSRVAEILRREPEYAPALFAKACITSQSGDPKATLAAWEEVLGHFHDFAPAQRALAILYSEDPEKMLIDIAADAGYSSKTVFNTQFLRIMGVSPSEYRKLNRIGSA